MAGFHEKMTCYFIDNKVEKIYCTNYEKHDIIMRVHRCN